MTIDVQLPFVPCPIEDYRLTIKSDSLSCQKNLKTVERRIVHFFVMNLDMHFIAFHKYRFLLSYAAFSIKCDKNI